MQFKLIHEIEVRRAVTSFKQTMTTKAAISFCCWTLLHRRTISIHFLTICFCLYFFYIFFTFFVHIFFICFHCNFLRSHCLFSLHFIFAFDLMPLHPLRLTGPAINMKLNRLHIAQSTKRRRMANGKMSPRHRSNRTKETEKTEKRVTSHWRRCRSTFESSRK